MFREFSQLTIRTGTLAGSRADVQYVTAETHDDSSPIIESIALQPSIDIQNIDEGDRATLATLLRSLADSLVAVPPTLPTQNV